MTNFRIIHKKIIERILNFRGTNPYIPGLVVAYSKNPANVEVTHLSREVGKSTYSFKKIARLIFSILFNYSIYPLRFLVVLGVIVAFFSFLMSGIFILVNLFHGVATPGWTSIVTLIAFFSGFIILLLGVLGEYIIFITKSVSYPSPYVIEEIKKHGA